MSTNPANAISSLQPQQFEDQASVQSGFILPCDIRVRLVRAESSGLDTILSLLYTSMFTVFGVFLGIVTEKQQATSPEIAATWVFGIFSVILLLWWVLTKIRQYEKGISLPSSILQGYEKK